MARHTRTTVAAISLAIATLTLSGCATSVEGEAATETTYDKSPLFTYLSALYDDEHAQQAHQISREAQIEMLVAECMHEQGFEYYPRAENIDPSAGYDDIDAPQPGTLEYTRQYGYGIGNSPLVDYMADQLAQMNLEVDPNVGYVNALSASELEAYEEAL